MSLCSTDRLIAAPPSWQAGDPDATTSPASGTAILRPRRHRSASLTQRRPGAWRREDCDGRDASALRGRRPRWPGRDDLDVACGADGAAQRPRPTTDAGRVDRGRPLGRAATSPSGTQPRPRAGLVRLSALGRVADLAPRSPSGLGSGRRGLPRRHGGRASRTSMPALLRRRARRSRWCTGPRTTSCRVLAEPRVRRGATGGPACRSTVPAVRALSASASRRRRLACRGRA